MNKGFLFRIKEVYRDKGIHYLFLAGCRKIVRIKKKILKKTLLWQDKLYNLYLFLYSKLLNKPLIYVIGDSHTKIFRRQRPFSMHHIGATTAYNLKKEKSTTNSNKQLFSVIDRINKKRDAVILSFGEIDCRIHIYNEYMKNNGKFTVTELINNTISNYGDILGQLDFMGVNFFVLGIVPASRQENVYGYPFYAAPEMRSKINKEFNERLKKFCQNKNYKYIDIYSKVSDENGFAIDKYAADQVHINNKAVKFVREFLKQQSLKMPL